MSSNIRITKVCEYCKNEFEARTILTRYCSHVCNRKAYRHAEREEKLQLAIKSNQQTKPIGKLKSVVDYSILQNKELLTINETCLLLNITHVTLRRWIKDNIITSSRIGKKHLIRRSHLNHLIA
jgi:excisionase family DNA binding protein